MTASITTVVELAQDVLRGWEMNWDGQRVYAGAITDAELTDGEQRRAEGDRIAIDAELRAEAAGIDVLDVIYLAEQFLECRAPSVHAVSHHVA